MDFSLNEDQHQFIELARQFSDKQLSPYAAKWDKEHIFPKKTIHLAGELGFCGLYSPSNEGGMGLSRLDSALIFEELARGCTTTTAMITIHNMATWMLTTWGTQQIKQRWSAPLTLGEKLASYCLTEAGSGSDAASLKTCAIKKDNRYIITGEKMFISGAGETDLLIVMCRTSNSGTHGISAIAVPADLDGIRYGKPEDKMGWNAQPTCSISFDQVEVPIENLLGQEGDGFLLAMKGLDGGRINIASCSVGTAQAAMEHATQYMQERQQFGKPLAAFQALQFTLADMATSLVAARQMIRLAAYKLDHDDQEATAYCAMAKQFATDVSYQVCDSALQIYGGYGYTKEYPLERYVRDVRVHKILEGTNEIMRLIIARRLLNERASAIL